MSFRRDAAHRIDPNCVGGGRVATDAVLLTHMSAGAMAVGVSTLVGVQRGA